jgi:hypothetical protein
MRSRRVGVGERRSYDPHHAHRALRDHATARRGVERRAARASTRAAERQRGVARVMVPSLRSLASSRPVTAAHARKVARARSSPDVLASFGASRGDSAPARRPGRPTSSPRVASPCPAARRAQVVRAPALRAAGACAAETRHRARAPGESTPSSRLARTSPSLRPRRVAPAGSRVRGVDACSSRACRGTSSGPRLDLAPRPSLPAVPARPATWRELDDAGRSPLPAAAVTSAKPRPSAVIARRDAVGELDHSPRRRRALASCPSPTGTGSHSRHMREGPRNPGARRRGPARARRQSRSDAAVNSPRTTFQRRPRPRAGGTRRSSPKRCSPKPCSTRSSTRSSTSCARRAAASSVLRDQPVAHGRCAAGAAATRSARLSSLPLRRDRSAMPDDVDATRLVGGAPASRGPGAREAASPLSVRSSTKGKRRSYDTPRPTRGQREHRASRRLARASDDREAAYRQPRASTRPTPVD